MKRLILAFWIVLAALLGAAPSYAQTASQICVQSSSIFGGNNCIPVTSSAPLPIAVYDSGNHSGYVYTSNGSASPATFQATTTGGGSVAISATTSNVTYKPLFATSTSASASTVYVDFASPWSYNASTGLTSILGITTTSFTDNGNAALNGTTTITTARITGGTINGTTIGATTSSSGVFTAITTPSATITGGTINGTTIGATTSTTAVVSTLVSGGTTFSNLTTGALSVNGTGVVASGTLAVSNGGTGASSAGITAFNNITGYTAAGATGTTSTNLVFSTSPTFITPTLGAATGTSLNLATTGAAVANGVYSSAANTFDISTNSVKALEVSTSGIATFSKAVVGAQSAVSLTTTTFTPDLAVANAFSLALTTSCVCGVANPANVTTAVGQTGIYKIVQPASATTTVSWGSQYKFAGGVAPVLSTTTGSADYFSYYVDDSTHVVISGGVLNAR